MAPRSDATEPLGAIAYVRGAGQAGGDIFVTSVDGSRTQQLTRTRGVHGLAFSPDGRRIVFDRRVPGKVGPMGYRRSEIWTINASGGEARHVTLGASDYDPAWSNDGRHILFSRHLFNPAGDWADAIFSVRLAGGAARRVTTPSLDDHGTCDFDSVSWPRFPVVVFVRDSYCDHGFDSEIDAVDAAGRPITILGPVGAPDAFDYVRSPDFTLDGRFVAFDAAPTVNSDSAEGIHVGRPEGGRCGA
jgi:dipeptidyl aminopeptidase/acylaminoacyl peptidase